MIATAILAILSHSYGTWYTNLDMIKEVADKHKNDNVLDIAAPIIPMRGISIKLPTKATQAAIALVSGLKYVRFCSRIPISNIPDNPHNINPKVKNGTT